MALLGFAPVSAAETPSLVVTIATDTVDSGDNKTSLREALALANSDPAADTITFSDGTGGTVNFHDSLPETIILGGTELLAYTEMRIIGPGSDRLAISADNRSRVFQFGGEYSVKTLSGLSILNGRTSTSIGYDNGGGIMLFGGELTLNRCVVSGNIAAWSGGGIYVTYGGKLTLFGSTISGNTAKFGGGIYTWANDVSDSVSLALVQCTVSGNSATYGDGGGIHSVGGGILRGNKLSMTQSTVSGNTAERTAGGIITGLNATNLTQNTVSGNVARGRDSGAAGGTTTLAVVGGIYATTCTLELENCIMANSTGADFFKGSVTLNLRGKNLIEDASIPAGANVITTDPLLGPLQNNGGMTFTHALLSGSPAINAVDNASVPPDAFDMDGDLDTTETLPFDQRGSGFPRTNETLDIGAYELAKSVGISADAASQEEGTGAGDTAFTFTVSRVVSTAGDVTVDYVVSGAAVNGADFGGSIPSGSVTIPDGQASTTLTIKVAKDTTSELNEAFIVTLSNANNGYLIVGSAATSTITDDDSALISISAPDASADENTKGPGTWRISRTGSVAAAMTVWLAIDPSSTTSAADWTQTGAAFSSLSPNATGTVIFPAGAAFVDITLTPVADIHAEAAETARLNLIADASYVISGTGNSTITIAANDSVVINTNNAGEGTLRQSILNANASKGSDTITFEGSTFSDTIVPDTIDLSSQLPNIVDQLKITGLGEGKLVIRRPQASQGTFALVGVSSGGSVVIEKLTLTGGNGGISNQGTLRVDQCVLSGNSAGTYGGILNSGKLTVSNSTLSANRSISGVGGGIYNLAKGSLTVVSSCLTGNSSRNAGGGIAIVAGSSVVVVNSTISGNSAQSSGAGISNGGTLSVYNSTITGNSGTGSGGGIATYIGSTLTLKNSIVAGNVCRSDNDISTFSASNLITSNGANFIGDKTGAAGSTSTDMSFPSTGTDLARLLGPLAYNGGTTQTHMLVDRSPAYDAGDTTAIPLDILDLDADSDSAEPLPFDQRGPGFDRIIGSAIDIGSYEGFVFAPLITNTTTDEDIQSTNGLAISTLPGDGGLTTHFRITAIVGGILYQNDGVTPIMEDDFITKAQGSAGLKFLPSANLNSLNTPHFGFSVQAAVSAEGIGLRGNPLATPILVNPINDAPTIIAPGLVDQGMTIGQTRSLSLDAVFTDLDGPRLAFAVLSSSNPSLVSATVSGSSLQLKALANGVTGIAIQADDGRGGTVVDWFSISVGTVGPTWVQVGHKGRLNTQTGLFEIMVKVTNTTPHPMNGFRLHVDFDAYQSAYPSLRLENATSASKKNHVYFDYTQAVAVDAMVPLTLSFYTKTRTFPRRFSPILAVEFLAVATRMSAPARGATIPLPMEQRVHITRMPDQTMKLVFPTVAGRWYCVRYSPDLVKWTKCPVPFQATSGNSEWVDSGPPFTSAAPMNTPSRYYLLDEIAAP